MYGIEMMINNVLKANGIDPAAVVLMIQNLAKETIAFMERTDRRQEELLARMSALENIYSETVEATDNQPELPMIEQEH